MYIVLFDKYVPEERSKSQIQSKYCIKRLNKVYIIIIIVGVIFF